MYPYITLWAEVTFRSYNLFAALGAFSAFVIAVLMLKKVGYKLWQSAALFVSGAIFFLIGARLLNYAVNYQSYAETGYSVFKLSFGHFSVFGGMAFAVIPAYILSKVWKKSFLELGDRMVIPFCTAFSLMRIGCFLNGCCYGKSCDVFWGVPEPESLMKIKSTVYSLIPKLAGVNETYLVYPTQLMEMGFSILFVAIAAVLLKSKKPKGTVIFAFSSYFATFRLFVLYFRELPYSDFVIYVVYPLIYGICILAGAVGIYIINKKTPEKGV